MQKKMLCTEASRVTVMHTEVSFLRHSSISTGMLAEMAGNSRAVAAMYAHVLYIIAAAKTVGSWSIGCCLVIKTPDIPDAVIH